MNTQSLQGKKVLMVVAPQDFKDEEYSKPRNILENSDAEISVASLNLGEAVGASGTKVKIDILATEAESSNFDAVVFVGGSGMVELVNKQEFKELALKFYEKGKLTTAICIAPMILANAGILQNKTATVWPDAKDDFIKLGVNYTGNLVETDGNIITANGPKAAEEFGQVIVEYLIKSQITNSK